MTRVLASGPGAFAFADQRVVSELGAGGGCDPRARRGGGGGGGPELALRAGAGPSALASVTGPVGIERGCADALR